MSQTVSTTPNADWARAALAALGQKQQAVASSTIGTTGTNGSVVPPPALAAPPPRQGQALAAPKGSGAPRTLLGKKIGRELFGEPDARRGAHPDPNDPKLQDEPGDDTEMRRAKKEAREARQATIDKSARFKEMIDTQHKLGTAAAVTVSGKGGRELKGNFFNAGNQAMQNGKPDTSRPVVLFLSGSGGTAEDQGTDVAEFYQETGASMMAVNYGGYGQSTGGDPSEKSLLEDGQAMLQHLLDLGYDSEQIIIHGYSMGGAVAGMLQAHNEKQDDPVRVRGLVLDRPMLSSTAGVKAKFGKGKVLDTIAAAATRASLGSMSARKALLALDSYTRAVVTSDEVTDKRKQGKDQDGNPTYVPKDTDFAQGAEIFRTQLKNKKATRSVEGLQSGADHFDNRAMLDTNKDLLRTLVTAPGAGVADKTAATDARDEHQKTTLAKLGVRIADRIQTANMEGNSLGGRLSDARNEANGMGKPLSTQDKATITGKLRAIEAEANDLLDEMASYAAAPQGALPNHVKGKILSTPQTLARVIANVLIELGALGEAVTVGPSAVTAILNTAKTFKTAVLDSLNPALLTGSYSVEVDFLRDQWPRIALATQGTPVLTAEEQQLVADLTQFKAGIDGRLAQAQAQAQPQSVPPPALPSTGPGTAPQPPPLPKPKWQTTSARLASRRGSLDEASNRQRSPTQ